MLLGVIRVVLVFATFLTTTSCAAPARVRISEIKANASRSDGMTVNLVGILDSGHLGAFLQDKVSEDIIRLRLVTPGTTENVSVVQDSLYERLCALAEKRELPGGPLEKFEVQIVGRIRDLKVSARPDKKFYPQIESPVEVTLIRVLSISRVEATK